MLRKYLDKKKNKKKLGSKKIEREDEQVFSSFIIQKYLPKEQVLVYF